MKAEDRKQLETNSLARGVGTLVQRAKTGRLVNPWVLAVLIAVLVGGGVWYYLAYEGGKLSSKAWMSYLHSPTASDLKELVDIDTGATTAKVARLELARIQLGPDGIAALASSNREQRSKGIENVEKAREELTKLAEEFKGDPTMRATCLLAAAEAELALVGFPKDGSGPESRGTVARAAELYREVAKIAGDDSPTAATYRKRAEELESKKDQIADVGSRLNFMLVPSPSFTFPGAGTGPKPPEGPIGTPTPPEGTSPKAPTAPVIPPTGTGTNPPVPPSTPPTTVPTKKS